MALSLKLCINQKNLRLDYQLSFDPEDKLERIAFSSCLTKDEKRRGLLLSIALVPGFLL